MTGFEFRAICARLDLQAPTVAALVGVHASSVYRWLGCGDCSVAKLTPLQAGLLEVLRDLSGRPDAPAIGAEIDRATAKGGPLAGVRRLLDASAAA